MERAVITKGTESSPDCNRFRGTYCIRVIHTARFDWAWTERMIETVAYLAESLRLHESHLVLRESPWSSACSCLVQRLDKFGQKLRTQRARAGLAYLVGPQKHPLCDVLCSVRAAVTSFSNQSLTAESRSYVVHVRCAPHDTDICSNYIPCNLETVLLCHVLRIERELSCEDSKSQAWSNFTGSRNSVSVSLDDKQAIRHCSKTWAEKGWSRYKLGCSVGASLGSSTCQRSFWKGTVM